MSLTENRNGRPSSQIAEAERIGIIEIWGDLGRKEVGRKNSQIETGKNLLKGGMQ